MMENDFLQSIKLEISRTVTLNAYERIAFHKILSMEKSESGTQILIRDLQKPDDIRKSALTALRDFTGDDVTAVFRDILAEPKNIYELTLAFQYFEKNKTPDILPALIEYFKKYGSDNTYAQNIQKIIYLIGQHTDDSDQAQELLLSIAKNPEAPVRQRQSAIESITLYTDLSLYESILDERNDSLMKAVFNTIAEISQREMDKYRPTDTSIFTKTPEREDTFLLNIRVLLSKMTNQFESFSNETKNAFIKALLACNHREYIVYIMKALTSDDASLIDTTLYTILANINLLSNPDKLFRSLISLPSLTSRDDTIIEEVFIRYFSSLPDNRSSSLIRDKIYNYIIVMLDSFFENYRKNYMIPDIVEKDHIEEFQTIRKFVLDRLNPRLKRRLMKFLTTRDIELKTILLEISESIAFIPPEEEDAFRLFLENLNEADPKTREITASRINDIDYEKKYLKHRIIRLCTIIGTLKIQEASTTLVKILNYVKKYFDADLYYSTALSLSHLNYPYMLGELELVLQVDETEAVKKKTVELLSQYSEHRALGILLDYLKMYHRDDDPLLPMIMSIVMKQDLNKDKVVNDIAKMIIEQNPNTDTASKAVLLLGKTAFEKDILYLHELIIESEKNAVKEAAVQSIQMIADFNPNYKNKNVVPFYKGYLRDPAIRVRIYSCIFLVQAGDTGSLTQLKDMMVIKNKGIQRDILLILGKFITVELAFFLLTLVNEEYAISNDIIPLFHFLEEQDRQQIDYFVANLFKRHEGTRFEYNKKHTLEQNEKFVSQLKSFTSSDKLVMRLSILNMSDILGRYHTAELSVIKIDLIQILINSIESGGGLLSRVIAGQIIACFDTSPDCAGTAIELIDKLAAYNTVNPPHLKIHVLIYIEKAAVTIANGEILYLNHYNYDIVRETGLSNRIFIRKDTADTLNLLYKSDQFPDTAIRQSGTALSFNELISPLNFNSLTEEINTQIKLEKRRRQEDQQELEKTVLKHKHHKSTAALEMHQSLDNIGKLLKKDLNEINKYAKKRSTDRELIRQIEQMTANVFKRYNVEISKIKLE